MANLTLTVPDDLRKEIKQHKEVNWSEIARRAMSEHLRKLHLANAIVSKSKLTMKDVKELDKIVKKGLAERYN